MEWTNDQVISLINEYKNRPVLWDPNHVRYRVQTAKYEAWCELSEIFDCEIFALRKKFDSIFASHRREKSKVRNGARSTWFLYENLNFLPNHLGCDGTVEQDTAKKRKKTAVIEKQDAEDSEQDYEEDGTESPVHIIIKEEPDATPPKAKYVNSKRRLTRLVKRRVVNDNQPERSRVIERKIYKRPEIYNNKKKDECDTFGEYIAMSLRKHDERTRSMIKQAINNILFEQEMKKYNNISGQYVVISSNIEENPLVSGDECEK